MQDCAKSAASLGDALREELVEQDTRRSGREVEDRRCARRSPVRTPRRGTRDRCAPIHSLSRSARPSLRPGGAAGRIPPCGTCRRLRTKGFPRVCEKFPPPPGRRNRCDRRAAGATASIGRSGEGRRVRGDGRREPDLFAVEITGVGAVVSAAQGALSPGLRTRNFRGDDESVPEPNDAEARRAAAASCSARTETSRRTRVGDELVGGQVGAAEEEHRQERDRDDADQEIGEREAERQPADDRAKGGGDPERQEDHSRTEGQDRGRGLRRIPARRGWTRSIAAAAAETTKTRSQIFVDFFGRTGGGR